MQKVYAALVKAQSKIKPAIKDSKNPHYKSSYADLASVWDAIREALHSNGLAVVQLTGICETNNPLLITRVIHESGEHIEGIYPILCKDPNDPQKLLSAITYARRGALAAMIGVTAEDDDGNVAAGISASQPTVKPEQNKNHISQFTTSPKIVANDPAHKNMMVTHIKFLREKNGIWSEEYTKTHGAKAIAQFADQGLTLMDIKDALIKYAADNK